MPYDENLHDFDNKISLDLDHILTDLPSLSNPSSPSHSSTPIANDNPPLRRSTRQHNPPTYL